MLEDYGPDKVSEITGIDKLTIVSLARSFALASKPLAICGRGDGSVPGSIYEFMAVHSLNALTGNINKNGGGWTVPEPDYIKWAAVKMDLVAQKGMKNKRIDAAGSQNYPYTKYLLNRLPQVINSAKEAPVQALFVADANPLYTMHDTDAVKNAFDKIPFVVSFSSYMNETAKNADLILPNHA